MEQKATKRNELFNSKYNMELIENNTVSDKINSDVISTDEYVVYSINKETLNKMGLEELANNSEDNEYSVVYDLADFTKFDVIYNDGLEFDGDVYWNLSSLQEKIEE